MRAKNPESKTGIVTVMSESVQRAVERYKSGIGKLPEVIRFVFVPYNKEGHRKGTLVLSENYHDSLEDIRYIKKRHKTDDGNIEEVISRGLGHIFSERSEEYRKVSGVIYPNGIEGDERPVVFFDRTHIDERDGVKLAATLSDFDLREKLRKVVRRNLKIPAKEVGIGFYEKTPFGANEIDKSSIEYYKF